MVIRCPLCRSDRVRLLFEKEEVPFYQCRPCKFRFARPGRNPNLDNRLEDFEPCYLQYLQPDPADEVNLPALCRWMDDHGAVSGLVHLDVGCGGGKFVRHLRSAGYQAYGLEPNQALFEHFLAGDPCFVRGTLESLGRAPVPQTFDRITALDVLEHVADPMAFLEQLRARLSPGGHLFLSLPDAGSLPARLLGKHWHFYHAYHLSYFSQKTLTDLVRRLGFRVLGVSLRGRYRSLGYVLRYGFDYVLRRPAPRLVARLDRVYLPVNLFDTMYLACRLVRPVAEAHAAASEQLQEAA